MSNNRYDWDKWLGPPGGIRTDHYHYLWRGEHFPVRTKISSFRQTCQEAARKRKVVIATHLDPADEDLVILHVIGPRREI